MTALPDDVRTLLTSGKLAHLVTINPDGSPQVSIVWVGLDGDEIVSGHMIDRRKLRNVRRDPRVAISLEAGSPPGTMLAEYLVVHGTARVVEGGAAGLLRGLGKVYVGPDFDFPVPDDPDAGWILRVSVDRIGGHGPWAPPQ